MEQSEINRIMKKYKKEFDILENYDKTRELPFQRKRIDIKLSVETINKLKQKTGKPISRLIEERILKKSLISYGYYLKKVLRLKEKAN